MNIILMSVHVKLMNTSPVLPDPTSLVDSSAISIVKGALSEIQTGIGVRRHEDPLC